MSNIPLVSVVIPAYNHEKYVQETINSIIAQTHQNIELIIIDDGSKDATWQKIQEMKPACEKRFTRIHFETKPNEGVCTTLNKLISLASGEYIYLIASDDMAKPQAIEKEVAFLDNNPDYVLVVGDNELINADSQRIGWDKKQNSISLEKAEYKSFGEFLKHHAKDINFLSDQFGTYESFVVTNYIPNSYLIRADKLKTIHYTTEAPLEDWFMHLQLSKLGKYKYLDEILFSYRWHDTNTVKKREHMANIVSQTLLYEKKLVNSIADKKWKEVFDKKINRIRMKFNFFNIFKFYSVKNINTKQYFIELFGYKFLVKSREK